MNVDFVISRARRDADGNLSDPMVFRHHTWVGAAIGGAGLISGIIGSNKQSKDNRAAQAQNAALQDQQNRAMWANYLMTRGLSPNGAAPGQIPQGAAAINTRLPLYANVSRSRAAQGFRIGGGQRPQLASSLASAASRAPAGGMSYLPDVNQVY